MLEEVKPTPEDVIRRLEPCTRTRHVYYVFQHRLPGGKRTLAQAHALADALREIMPQPHKMRELYYKDCHALILGCGDHPEDEYEFTIYFAPEEEAPCSES